ncbi:MAG: helix-turn-helix domain-containing protein [Spirochaetia bacterium]|jgi:excisionase family DNA binding protein
MTDQPEPFLTVVQAASFLAVSKFFLYKWIDRIPHYRAGAKLAFRASELSAWMESNRAQLEVPPAPGTE